MIQADAIYALIQAVKSVVEDLKMGMDGLVNNMAVVSPSTWLLAGLLFGCLIFALTACRLWCNSCGKHEARCPCYKCEGPYSMFREGTFTHAAYLRLSRPTSDSPSCAYPPYKVAERPQHTSSRTYKTDDLTLNNSENMSLLLC